jgi:hypothetical protein
MEPPPPPAPAPELGLLTGPDAGDILRVVVGEAGGEVVSWRARQVDHQPGRGSTAAYRVRVRWPDGRVTEEHLAAHTGTPPPGTVAVGDGADRVAVWRFPRDPYLPGLPTAFDPGAVAGLLRSFGLADGPVRLLLRAYRPRRRAVVEAVGAHGRLFLKVVRPRRVEALHRSHRLVTAAGVPSPRSLGYTPDGLLVLHALPGVTMREAVLRGDDELPSGAALVSLLDRLPAELAEGPRRRSWLARAAHYAAVVRGTLPAEGQRADQLAVEIAAGGVTGPAVPVHGDFYENQVRVVGGRITGLLDLDTAGPGDRPDDLACLLGHLAVLAQIRPGDADAVNRLGSRYLAAFARNGDPVDLRYRVAAVVLSLATGPYRVQESGWQVTTTRRLDLVERWVDSARTAAGRR